MDIAARHPLPKALAAVDLDVPDKTGDVLLDRRHILELLVEMARKQQNRILKFTPGTVQRALAKAVGSDRGDERDRCYEREAAGDKPVDRSAAAGEASDGCYR